MKNNNQIENNDFLESGTFPESDNIVLSEMKSIYIQNSDNCSNSDVVQELEIETQDAGGGTFYILKTERWAFDNPEDLLKTINDFIRRFSPNK